MSDSNTKAVDDLYEAFLALSGAEQRRLLQRLAEGQRSDWSSSDIRQAWIAEAERRVGALDRGEMETVPLETALRGARERIANLPK